MLIAIFITIGTACAVIDSSEPRTHLIEIKQLRFSPDVIAVKPGDKVTWVNHDFVPHSATAMDQSWDTGMISQGESRSLVITRALELRYFCLYHPSMQAQLKIQKPK